MAEKLTELTEETLYCDNCSGSDWKFNTLSIDRNSDLYHRITNDSLPFYFINQYQNNLVHWHHFQNRMLFFSGAYSANDDYCYLGDVYDDDLFHFSTDFAHAIDPRCARNGKLLPSAILPVLQYHANCNARLYPGRVLTIDQDFNGDIEYHDDQNEIVLVIGTPEDVIHVHGNINTKSLVVLGCILIVDGDIYASDHIYAYALGLKANSITGNEDAICVSIFHTAQPYAEGIHSTLAIDPDSNPKLEKQSQLFECLEAAGWISYELKEHCCRYEGNLERILKAATIKSKLTEIFFAQEDVARAAPAQDVWSEQAMEVMQWLQHPATSFADMRRFAIVGRCGVELPPNDPELQEAFRFHLIAALTEPTSRSKLELAWQLCGKLVDHRPLEDRKALPPGQQVAAVKQLQKPVSSDDFYEVVDDQQ